jgi:U4/U6.U5 tri-snRNP-associated protein 1
MDVEWSESRYDDRSDKDDSPVRAHYDDDADADGVDKSSRHRIKDRKKSDKEHRIIEKDRGSRRERNRDDREKDGGKDGKVREKDYDREKYREKERERERDRDKKDRGKDRERGKEREIEKDSDRVREKERGKEKTRDRDRDKVKEREREKHRDRESYRDGDRDKGKDKVREERERETDRDKDRSRDRGSRRTHEEDYESGNLDDKVDYHEKRDEEVGKHAKSSKPNQDDKDGETTAHLSSKELEERILRSVIFLLNRFLVVLLLYYDQCKYKYLLYASGYKLIIIY